MIGYNLVAMERENMKRPLALICMVIATSACAPLPHELGDAPFKGEITTHVYDQKDDNLIIEKGTFFGESNFYYSASGMETFLLNIAFVDSSEIVRKALWSDDGSYYAFLITNSTRFECGTRLAVYTFTNATPSELADVKDAEITDVRFAAGLLIYTDASGREYSVPTE